MILMAAAGSDYDQMTIQSDRGAHNHPNKSLQCWITDQTSYYYSPCDTVSPSAVDGDGVKGED